MAPTNETAKECCRCKEGLTLHDEAAWDGHGNSLDRKSTRLNSSH